MNKQIEEMADAIFQNCQCGLFFSEAEKIADFVINNQGYRKSTDVLGEVLNILSDLKEDYLADDDVREACAISYAEIKIAELKKRGRR